MKNRMRITFSILAGIFALGFIAWRVWFHNPYQDTLRLDPQTVFFGVNNSNALFIRNATLIDAVSGEAVPIK